MGAGASTPSTQPQPAQQPAASSPPASCPVDHKAREVWLSQHRDAVKAGNTESTDKSPPPNLKTRPLSSDREISSIPRAFPQPSDSTQDASTPASACPVPHGASHAAPPSNNESETGQDKATGRWIYPSEKQFFEALLRKNTPNSASSPKDLATSVASIIPIHNAVNERAWSEILTWESRAPMSDPGSAKCGGPKLYSFRGLGVESQFLSPRARLNSLLGYQLPFDRHDWTVERCDGERIDYVIDFYQGRSSGGGLAQSAKDGKLSFYLDVRPKLNTWEGCRMRVMKCLGLA